MKAVYVDGDSLKKIGITLVTGEACALSMRLLCYLTPSAMQDYLSYTGISVPISVVPMEGEHFTVFLTWEAMEDLMIMHLMKIYERVVEIHPEEESRMGGYLLAGGGEEVKDALRNAFTYSQENYNEDTGTWTKTKGMNKIGRSYHIYAPQPRNGFSNISAFTGTSH